MHWRKRLLKKSLLYLILDKDYLTSEKTRGFFGAPEIGIIQLRDKTGSKTRVLKNARWLRKKIDPVKSLFIINDYADLVLKSGADGVHLGQDDLSVKAARRLLGPDKIIGLSCHNLAQALKAQKDGADYIGIGPIYPTPTKPAAAAIGIKAACKLSRYKIKIPYFAIGDIHPGNLEALRAAGIKRVAVCRAVLAARNPCQISKGLYRKLKT